MWLSDVVQFDLVIIEKNSHKKLILKCDYDCSCPADWSDWSGVQTEELGLLTVKLNKNIKSTIGRDFYDVISHDNVGPQRNRVQNEAYWTDDLC
jgi:hypothetical protein